LYTVIQRKINYFEIGRRRVGGVEENCSSVDIHKELVLLLQALRPKLDQANEAQLLHHLKEGEEKLSATPEQFKPHLTGQVHEQQILFHGVRENFLQAGNHPSYVHYAHEHENRQPEHQVGQQAPTLRPAFVRRQRRNESSEVESGRTVNNRTVLRHGYVIPRAQLLPSHVLILQANFSLGGNEENKEFCTVSDSPL